MRKSKTDWETLGEVQVGSGNPLGGSEKGRGPSGRFGTGHGILRDIWDGSGTLGEVLDGSEDPWGVLEEFLFPSEQVRDGLGDPSGGPGMVRGPSGRSGTGKGTLGEYRDGLGDTWRGPGRIKGLSGRFVKVWGTLG